MAGGVGLGGWRWPRPREPWSQRREGERGGERKQGEGGRELGARMGGCLGSVNSFGAGRNPDNGKGDGSRSRAALKQTWRPGQPPATDSRHDG